MIVVWEIFNPRFAPQPEKYGYEKSMGKDIDGLSKARIFSGLWKLRVLLQHNQTYIISGFKALFKAFTYPLTAR